MNINNRKKMLRSLIPVMITRISKTKLLAKSNSDRNRIIEISTDYDIEEFKFPPDKFVLFPESADLNLSLCIGVGRPVDNPDAPLNLYFLWEFERRGVCCFPSYRKKEFEHEGFILAPGEEAPAKQKAEL